MKNEPFFKSHFTKEELLIHKKFFKSASSLVRDASIMSLIVSPVIYSLFIPLVLLDIWGWCYQTICFSSYDIAKVKRSQYIIFDRGHLKYLNWIELINCNYCAYANGLISYSFEIASRTEQYFCPIKHNRAIRSKLPSYYDKFINYDDASGYRKNIKNFRAKLKK